MCSCYCICGFLHSQQQIYSHCDLYYGHFYNLFCLLEEAGRGNSSLFQTIFRRGQKRSSPLPSLGQKRKKGRGSLSAVAMEVTENDKILNVFSSSSGNILLNWQIIQHLKCHNATSITKVTTATSVSTSSDRLRRESSSGLFQLFQ